MISRAQLSALDAAALDRVATMVDQMAEARDSGRVPWLCSKEGCDGSPHKGRPGPHARPNQRLPGNGSEFDTLMALAGRGFGKTRTGSEWVWRMAKDFERGGLVGPTAADTRDIMVEGESGILACAPATFRPVYEPSKRKLTYPNGAIQMLYSADEPDRLRGPQHHYIWCIAEGEPVLTDRGWVPIQSVSDSDRVWTRRGWAACTGAHRTKTNADLVEVIAASGDRVVCTPEHRIAVPGGWEEARNIKSGDTIYVWNSQPDRDSHPHGSCGVDGGTTNSDRDTTGTPVDGFCTATCGSRSTETSRSDTSSTTSITTRQTTTCAISCPSPGASTQRTTHETDTRPAPMTTSITRRALRPPEAHGSADSHGMSCVSGAVSCSSRQECVLSTAPARAVESPVVSISPLPLRSDVYDIGVPGYGEFIAGGIVVHNCDEMAAWRRLQYAWDMLQMGLRLGEHPQALVTTTPRPLPLIKALVKDPLVYVVRGSTYDNLSNLAPTFRRAVVARYEGTTLGRQELDAEILDDLPGALLSRAVIDAGRVDVCPDLLLRVVAMDPAGTGRRDETGLIAGGQGPDGDAYITHDVSGSFTPREAAMRAWALMDETDSDVLVYEDNFGKGWVKEVLVKTWKERGGHGHPPIQEVWASLGKQLRAQPVVMKYEQRRVHHVGVFPELEDQYTTWLPEEDPKSPDRVDAAVHLVAFLSKRFDLGPVSAAAPAMLLASRNTPGAMRRGR